MRSVSCFHLLTLPMNTDVLDKPIVLSLNRAWQVIGHRTVKQALIALNGGAAGLPPALGVDRAAHDRFLDLSLPKVISAGIGDATQPRSDGR